MIDEAYCEFSLLDDPDASIDLLERHPNLVLLRTFSKIYGLCGLRVGYALCGSRELPDAVNQVRQPFFCNSAAQAAAIEALRHQDEVARRVERAAIARVQFEDGLRELGIEPASSQANFCWFALGEDRDDREIADALAQRGMLRPRRQRARPRRVAARHLRHAGRERALPGGARRAARRVISRVGFLSFGHWQAVAGSQTPTASDALRQTIELAVAAEEIGIDGAYVRVHHFARQLGSPFPLLAAIGARTRRIEIGTAVIDMRYENPLYMAEDAAAADLIAGGRLQLGISRGSPEPALRGYESFGHVPREGETDADMARTHAAIFRAAIAGAGVARSDPRMTGVDTLLPIQPQAPGLAERIWWGAGTRQTAVWAAEQGMNLQSSTLLSEDTGVPFGELQAEQIELYRGAWAAAGHEREPRISISRSVLPITTDLDRRYFGAERSSEDQIGYLEGVRARFGRSYIGEPDAIAEELARDPARARPPTRCC